MYSFIGLKKKIFLHGLKLHNSNFIGTKIYSTLLSYTFGMSTICILLSGQF